MANDADSKDDSCYDFLLDAKQRLAAIFLNEWNPNKFGTQHHTW